MCRGLRSRMVQGAPDTPLPSDSNLSASCQIPGRGGKGGAVPNNASHTCTFASSLLLSPTPGHSQLSPGGTRQVLAAHAPSVLPSPSSVCQSDCYFSVQNLQWNWIFEAIKGLLIISGGIVD